MKRLILIFALVLIPQLSFASNADRATKGPEQASTATERMEIWLDAINALAEAQPSLSPALYQWRNETLARTEESLFVDYPGEEESAVIVKQLVALRDAVGCSEFTDLASKLEGMKEWLNTNSLLPPGEGGCGGTTPTCTCSSNTQCASGYSCKSGGCYNPAGSTNWGTCGL